MFFLCQKQKTKRTNPRVERKRAEERANSVIRIQELNVIFAGNTRANANNMNEPTPLNNPNLDELTKLTLRVISLETELTEAKSNIGKEAVERLALEARIKILEESRQRQILLNGTFAAKEVGKVLAEKPIKRFKWF